jgi:hypothetical protein
LLPSIQACLQRARRALLKSLKVAGMSVVLVISLTTQTCYRGPDADYMTACSGETMVMISPWRILKIGGALGI